MEKEQTVRTRIIAGFSFIAVALIEAVIQKPVNDLDLSLAFSIIIKLLPIALFISVALWWVYKELIWFLDNYFNSRVQTLNQSISKQQEDIIALKCLLDIRKRHIQMKSLSSNYHYFTDDTNVYQTITDQWNSYNSKEEMEVAEYLINALKVNRDEATKIAKRVFQL